MASNSTKKQIHVSPGIYFSESELPVAVKSLGITNLGVAGETLRGPAFQVMDITSWSEYKTYFGGTSTEKYRGSKYPKYELPYIAKTYLDQSQNLKVCRVLGLSGVNAGKAWFITAYASKTGATEDATLGYVSDTPMVVAVLRSRGEHLKAAYLRKATAEDNKKGFCDDVYEYDAINYFAEKVSLIQSNALSFQDGCTLINSTEPLPLSIDANNYGQFTLVVDGVNGIKKYPVSLNPEDKNYIINVLGTNPEVGDTEIFVEELYDVALRQLIERGELDMITGPTADGKELAHYKMGYIRPKYQPVDGLLLEDESMLKRRDLGKRFLYSGTLSKNESDPNKSLTVHTRTGKNSAWTAANGENGHIYTVVAHTDTDGTRHYYYGETTTDTEKEELGTVSINDELDVEQIVYVKSMDLHYINKDKTVKPIQIDINNYKEQYRYSSTPWVVSEMKGSANEVELTKLFRFHTISDGNSSATEVKVSIENIRPDEGIFDVVVRDFYDTDANPVVVEKFQKVDMIPGSENYIAFRIGSFDEAYESKSKYITVEVNETDKARVSVPAGFMGYPVRNYGGNSIDDSGLGGLEIKKPYLEYNTNVYEEIRARKQYFGMSDLVGIDEDVLKYKGVYAYNYLADEEKDFITPCFHLDSRIFTGPVDKDGYAYSPYADDDNDIKQLVTVDGFSGYEWSTVGMGNTLNDFGKQPIIGTEEEMRETIYEDIRMRKFTLCFYGGWDGWDYLRTSRSNTDDFKYQRYRGDINTVGVEGKMFSVLQNPELYGFDKTEKCLNSDWYAYLSAIRQFANPKETDINVFATPGIDYVNHNTLVGEALEMIEEERADSIYVITTPDKPMGAGDNICEMFTAEDAVDNLEDSDIDSNWACTYYPWIKYFDQDNNQYIYLPPTKDVVKNFALTDNIAAPWYAAAGWNRGLTDGVKSKKTLVLAEQDELYGGRINYINKFADEGMRIWGDNNLQKASSKAHMNKISKRRCLIRLRKLISIACIGLVFDPNDNTTVSSFRSAVQPILEDFMKKRALIDAKLVIEDSQEARDRLELNAQIYLKFMPNLEYINIGLVATPNGVSFDDI